MVDERICTRLDQLGAHLGDREWLEHRFSAGDLLMVHALRRLEGSNLLEGFPKIRAYIARAEARPAYRRAFAAQLAVFRESRAR